MGEEAITDEITETVALGRFDLMELPIILDVLRDHGIFAMTKSPLDNPEASPYPMFGSEREILLVDRDRADEARRIIESEVRTRETEMSEGLGDAADDVSAEDLVPFGWLEPEVARELLRALADSDIHAVPEYPLEDPPPPYARADGRVRVHVEELFLDEAAAMLESDVREALAARGVMPAEPLREEDS